MNFCNLNENENQKTRHTVLGLNLARGLALLAQPNGYFGLADLATRRGRGARRAFTARRATHRARSRGRGLTEAVGRRRGGGGSGRRHSEATRKLQWLTVAVEGTCNIRGTRGRWGAKPFGQKRLEGGAHQGRWLAAAAIATLRQFHRAPGWSYGSTRGGRRWGVAQIVRSLGWGDAQRGKESDNVLVEIWKSGGVPTT
jgi:hypothetical protein